MAEIIKQLKTKIALKILPYSEWDKIKDSYKPLRGEVCLCEIPAPDATGHTEATTAPTVLFKVGDGTNFFGALKWASALAADVYAWAKKANPDWNDFPALPIEVVDNGAGKFVTGFTYADNKLTITRSDVDWSDVQNKPNLVNSVKVTDDDVVIGTPVDATSGDVTIDIKHKAYNKAGATTDVAGDATTAGSSVTIKVPTLTVDAYGHTEFTGETSHTITIPSEVAVGDGDITITAGAGLTEGGSFNVNQDSDTTITLKHADTSNVVNVTAADRTYVKSLTFDDFGHVTAVDVGTETVVDTNSAHTHAAGDGLKLGDVKGGIEGEVKYELNLAFGDLTADNKLQLLDATNNAVIAEFDAAAFVKDSFLDGASYDEDTNDLTLTFIDNSDNKQDIVIPLDDLVDVYTADETSITLTVSGDGKVFKVKDSGIETKHIKDGNVTEAKLEKNVTDALALARTALQSHQDITGKADKVTGAVAGNFAGLDANGNLVDSGKKAADFQPAGNYQPAGDYKTIQAAVENKITDAAHVITTLTQNANGEIAYGVKKLTPADIGAQVAGNYLTEVAPNNTDDKHSGIKVTDKNKIEIDDDVIFVLNANF